MAALKYGWHLMARTRSNTNNLRYPLASSGSANPGRQKNPGEIQRVHHE